MQITIQVNALKAISRFAPKQDIRYYLQGVFVESNPVETRLTATNGHVLAVHRADAKDENDGSWTGIIPLESIKSIMRVKVPKDGDYPIVITPVSDNEYRMKRAGESILFRPIDGIFPDYRKVIPKTVSGEPAFYDPEYLSMIQDAADDLDCPKSWIMGYNGNGTGIVQFHDNAVALIMPMRKDPVTDTASIEWAREPLRNAEIVQIKAAA